MEDSYPAINRLNKSYSKYLVLFALLGGNVGFNVGGLVAEPVDGIDVDGSLVGDGDSLEVRGAVVGRVTKQLP